MKSSARLAPAAQLDQHVRGSARAPRRRASRPARRRSGRPARARARPRSRRAGAARRRAGAGSGSRKRSGSSPTSSSARRTRSSCSSPPHALDAQRLGDDRRARAGAGSASGRGPGRSSGRAGAARAARPLPCTGVAVGGHRPGGRRDAARACARASVDLPQPDSPTTPRISPRRHSSETPSTARATVAVLAGSARSGRATSISASRSSGRLLVAASCGAGHSAHGAKWQAARLARRDLAQRRVLQAAVGGVGAARAEAAALAAGRPGRAGRRGSAAPARASPPITGSESSRRFVYGCCGAAKTSRTGPVSTIRPAYMTAIRSQVSASTPRSCGDQDQRQPELLAQVLEQLEDLRLHDDVERGRRLVGDHQRRPAGERERDHHPLALPARELVGVAARRAPGSARPSRAARRSGRARRRQLAGRSCRWIASAICSSTRWTGSSEFIAPWKTSEMWRQRTSCMPVSVRRPMLIGSSTSGRAQRDRAASAEAPAAAASSAPARSSSCRSPTRRPAPSASPRSSVRSTPSTIGCSPWRDPQVARPRAAQLTRRCSLSRGLTYSSNR